MSISPPRAAGGDNFLAICGLHSGPEASRMDTFNPEERLISWGRDLGIDIATFRVTLEEIVASGKKVVRGTDGAWPAPPNAGGVIYFGGFPGNERDPIKPREFACGLHSRAHEKCSSVDAASALLAKWDATNCGRPDRIIGCPPDQRRSILCSLQEASTRRSARPTESNRRARRNTPCRDTAQAGSVTANSDSRRRLWSIVDSLNPIVFNNGSAAHMRHHLARFVRMAGEAAPGGATRPHPRRLVDRVPGRGVTRGRAPRSPASAGLLSWRLPEG